jgi:dehydrogenase/reductase SDR family member 12
MITVEERVEIAVPRAAAFAYYAEYANIQDWDPGVDKSTKLTPGPLRVGDRYDVVSLFLGRRLPMVYEVVVLEAPQRVVLRGQGGTGVAVDDIRFDAKDDVTTVITWQLRLELSGLNRLAAPLLKPFVQRLGREAMGGIRTSAAQGLPLRTAVTARVA